MQVILPPNTELFHYEATGSKSFDATNTGYQIIGFKTRIHAHATRLFKIELLPYK